MNYNISKYLFKNKKDRNLLAILNYSKLAFFWAFFIFAIAVIIDSRAFQLEGGLTLKIILICCAVLYFAFALTYALIFKKLYKKNIKDNASQLFEGGINANINLKYITVTSKYKKRLNLFFITVGIFAAIFIALFIAAPFVEKSLGNNKFYVGIFIALLSVSIICALYYGYVKAKMTADFIISAKSELETLFLSEKNDGSSDKQKYLDERIEDERLGYLHHKVYMFPDIDLRNKYISYCKILETTCICFFPILAVCCFLVGFYMNTWSFITFNAIFAIFFIVTITLASLLLGKTKKQQKDILLQDPNKKSACLNLFNMYTNKIYSIFYIGMASLIFVLIDLILANLIYSWSIISIIVLIVLFFAAIAAIIAVYLKQKKIFEVKREALEKECENIYGEIFKSEIKEVLVEHNISDSNDLSKLENFNNNQMSVTEINADKPENTDEIEMWSGDFYNDYDKEDKPENLPDDEEIKKDSNNDEHEEKEALHKFEQAAITNSLENPSLKENILETKSKNSLVNESDYFNASALETDLSKGKNKDVIKDEIKEVSNEEEESLEKAIKYSLNKANEEIRMFDEKEFQVAEQEDNIFASMNDDIKDAEAQILIAEKSFEEVKKVREQEIKKEKKAKFKEKFLRKKNSKEKETVEEDKESYLPTKEDFEDKDIGIDDDEII